jgi:hypothetical protein
MLCNCLKIYKKITASILFQLAIIGCSCKKDRETTSPERENNPSISQHKQSSPSIPVYTEDNTHNVVATNSSTKPGTIEVTDALINPLLDNLIASLSVLEPGDSRGATPIYYLAQFLEAIYDQSPIDKLSSQSYVFYAILYKNTDILALTLDRLQGDINKPYIGLTFLQYATYFNNLPAIDLLLQKGADRKIVTKQDYTMDGIPIPTGSTAYDIALRLHKNEAAAKLQA